MADTYSEVDRTSSLSVPDFRRSRQPLRSPRNSYKRNLEEAQVRYSIHVLDKAYKDFATEFKNEREILKDGGVFGETTTEGFQSLLERASSLEKRIRTLEHRLS